MLDVQSLCKSLDNKPVLKELTFQVGYGECLILLGRNGAGKTLLLNILATLVEPTAGSLSIAGVDAFMNLKQVRPSIGYIPVAFEGYPVLSVGAYLDFFAAAYKLERSERAGAIDSVLELMDIQQLRDNKIADLSVGERQRLLFAKTFLHEPQLWLLDEPFTPLDPIGQDQMTALIGELQAMQKTVVIATNRLEDALRWSGPDSQVEKSFVGILSAGGFAVFDRFSALQRAATETDNPAQSAPNWLDELFLEVTKT